LKLVQGLGPGVELLAPGAPLPPFDFHCPLMSLPIAFGSNEATIPREVPYLRVDAARVQFWRRRLGAVGGDGLKVGLVWSGNARHGNDANRSIALAQFRRLAPPGCVLVSLQEQIRETDKAEAEAWIELHRWGEESLDFDDTAALIEALDLVISVDTSVAHLAGALGRPTWVLLPFCPDWRWMVARDDSPWYPSARLFRQASRQDWEPVLAAVHDSLREHIQQSGGAVASLHAPRPSWPVLIDHAQAAIDAQQEDRAFETLMLAEAHSGPHPHTLYLRGNALFAQARYAQAAEAYEAALAAKPDFVDAAASLSGSLFCAGRPQEALQRADEALRLRPDHAISLTNRILALQALGRNSEALDTARAAHQRLPNDADLEWSYGALALLFGNHEEGWPALEARWGLSGAGKRPEPAELGCPAWTGREPIQGRTLLLLSEQGAGDTLQFMRYVPLLVRRGARVVLCAPPSIEQLVRESLQECTTVTHWQDAPRADFHIPLMSLPLAMKTRLDSIPATVPYAHASAKLVDAWRRRLPAARGPRVGIVWSGNAGHTNDRNRSMPLATLLGIAVPGVQLVSLQPEVRDRDVAAFRGSGVLDVASELRTFAETAALIQTLDLVISVDTSVAHLTGALGRPLWVLLPNRPDWRWMIDRNDSPWYPTARLFRQPSLGDWGPVVSEVRAALELFATTTPAST
jgi:tetratricopeptide (TPR) repeat protein